MYKSCIMYKDNIEEFWENKCSAVINYPGGKTALCDGCPYSLYSTAGLKGLKDEGIKVVSKKKLKKSFIVLILNGPAEVGKGTFVKILKKLIKCDIVSRSSIDWAKEVAATKFGWDGQKTPASRALLGQIKKLGIEFNDIPFRDICDAIYQAQRNKCRIFTTDIREPDEIQKMVDYCQEKNISCLTIRIINYEKELYATANLAETDNMYSKYYYDAYISNNAGMGRFEMNVHEFVKFFIK